MADETPTAPDPTRPEDIAPDTSHVADLERTRLATSGGGTAADFSATTRPSKDQVQSLIGQASEAVLGQLPLHVPSGYHDRAKHLVALYAAVLVEGSFFRERLDEGSVELWLSLYRDGLGALQGALGYTPGMGDGTGEVPEGKTISSVRIKSVMADRDPLYDLYDSLPIY